MDYIIITDYPFENEILILDHHNTQKLEILLRIIMIIKYILIICMQLLDINYQSYLSIKYVQNKVKNPVKIIMHLINY